MGAFGNGAKTKLAINLVLGLNRAALAEGLVFAGRLGLPLEAFLEAAKGSAAYSQIMDVKGAKMIARDFDAARQGRPVAEGFRVDPRCSRVAGAGTCR